MMSRKSDGDILIKSNNGFAFKRKRQDGIQNENPLQQFKKEEDKISKDKPPVQVNLKNSRLTKELYNSFSENYSENVQEPEPQAKKTVQMNGKNKENKNATKVVHLKERNKNVQEDSDDDEGQEIFIKKDVQPEKVLSKELKELVISEKSLVKLPPYPMILLPLEFDIEVYEKENPYKRLSRMVQDICTKEEGLLRIEFKDHAFFLKLGIKILSFK